MSAAVLAVVPRQARQMKRPTVRHPGHSTAARAPPSSTSSHDRTSALPSATTGQHPFQFQEIKHS